MRKETDTICAIATAPGGALGIIRLSGPEAITIARRVCRGVTATTPAGTAHLCPISLSSEVIDEALVTLFRAPHSYTGEDTVEFSLHGSPYILQRTLEALIAAGARQAAPGEFTQRAFLNGKLDLSQAEAVADLIASTNRATHHLALSQLRGHFSSELAQLREQLLRLTSLLELELDFSDHEDLEFADRTELLTLAETIDTRVCHLAETFHTGNALKQGIPVAIVGKTNVGKSTLLNALVGDDRAIVSDIHGTTRDTIEDTITLGGIPFRFIDTAGLRHTTDTIEQIGIQRTYAAIDRASIILWLIDEQPSEADITDITTRAQGKTLLLIVNKADTLLPSLPDTRPPLSSPLLPYAAALPQPPLLLSAKTGLGLDTLRTRLTAAAPHPADTDVIVTSARHYDALLRAHAHLQRVIDGLRALSSPAPTLFTSTTYPAYPSTTYPAYTSSDLVAEDLRLVLSTLGEITGGTITPQETLTSIFSHFCVGK